MNRRELMLAGVVALVPAMPAMAGWNTARRATRVLYDGRYRESARFAGEAGLRGATVLEVRGRDVLRLWVRELQVCLDCDEVLAGLTTYSDWQILRYSALAARHRVVFEAMHAVRGAAPVVHRILSGNPSALAALDARHWSQQLAAALTADRRGLVADAAMLPAARGSGGCVRGSLASWQIARA